MYLCVNVSSCFGLKTAPFKMEVFVAIANGFHVLNVVCQRVFDFAHVEGIFMQINNKTFEKFITMNSVSEICSQFLNFIARFYAFPQ